MNALIRYRTLLEIVAHNRHHPCLSEEFEDRLLEEMDEIWHRLAAPEQALMNSIAAQAAAGAQNIARLQTLGATSSISLSLPNIQAAFVPPTPELVSAPRGAFLTVGPRNVACATSTSTKNLHGSKRVAV